MRLNVKEGRTLLVDGPASFKLISGKVKVLGATIKAGDRIVVRNGKRLPFEVTGDALIELVLSEISSFLEIDGSAFPKSWKVAVNELFYSNEPVYQIF